MDSPSKLKRNKTSFPKKCSWLKDDNEYCKNSRDDKSFFCKIHKIKLYPVSKFSLLHMVPNYEDVINILFSKEQAISPSSETKVLNRKWGEILANPKYDQEGNLDTSGEDFGLPDTYFQLLSPTDLLNIDISYDPDDRIISYTDECFLIFKPDFIKEKNSHISLNWNVGNFREEDSINYDHDYSLKENLNLWSNFILKNRPLFETNEYLTVHEIVIKNDSVPLKFMKTIYYPADIYLDIICYNSSLFNPYNEEFIKTLYDYIKKLYIVAKRSEIVTGYKWTLSSTSLLMKNLIYNSVPKPWKEYKNIADSDCLKRLKLKDIDIFNNWKNYKNFEKKPDKVWSKKVII